MKVWCYIKGIDSEDVLTITNETIGCDRVELKVGDKSITVYVKELKRAIENCMND